MQTLKKFYFGKQKAKVNTYIGGIGGTINTPALLAAKLGIAENRIKLFKVTGVDVECAIVGGSYNILESFKGDLSITYFDDKDGLVLSCGNNAFSGFGTADFNLKWINLPNCISLNGLCFSYRYAMEFLKAEKVKTITGTFNFNRTNIKNLIFPELTSCSDFSFANETISISNQLRIYIYNCLTLGASNGLNNVFSNIKNGCVLYVNPFLQTSNGGAEEGDVANARSQGAVIRYVTNFTPPNAITNLSSGTIYNSAVQLNFTPPTSVNGVDFYEVYINGERINSKEIKSSGEFITGLTPSTNYNIRIVAVDMFYNKSEMSNTINVSTNTVDADPYLYINASENQSYETPIVNLFTSLKEQGLYNKIQAFYPFLGTTQAQHKWNAKNPQDTNAAFRLQFFGGGTHSNLGYQCNGTNAYANTFIKHSDTNPLNNGFTIVFGTNNYKGSVSYDIGFQGGAPYYYGYSLVVNVGNPLRRIQAQMNKYISGGTTGGNVEENNVADIRGGVTATSIGNNLRKLYRNKSLRAIQNTGLIDSVTSSFELFIGALNNSGASFGHSNQRIQFTAIHEGLTDAEVVALHTIIDNFENAIGRKTW